MLEFIHNHESREPVRLVTRGRYNLTRFTIIAPDNHPDGTPASYADSLRGQLLGRGHNWTEYKIVGVWKGRTEPGTLFELYHGLGSPDLFAELLAHIGRSVMPDQEAVQVTFDREPTVVLEG